MTLDARFRELLLLANFLFLFNYHSVFAKTVNEPILDSHLDEMLSIASKKENETHGHWDAAVLYCKASRQGSIEAQYRLAVLYAFGKGVPKNRAYAATLLSIASRQGHYKAFNMLEVINFSAETLPPCIENNVDPERLSVRDISTLDDAVGIDRYIAYLPKNKRWALDIASTTAEWYEIDPKLVISVIAIESGFEERAKSNANAMGMMQLIPATAERFNVKNAFDATQNIKGGVRYLKWLLNYYLGDIELAVSAYNAGEKAVDRYRGVPPYKETKEYLRKFKLLYKAKFHPYASAETTSPIKK